MKNIFLLLLLLCVASCASDINVTASPTKFPEVKAPTAQPMNFQDMSWKIYNKADLLALIDQLSKNPDKNFALYTLDGTNFKALDSNLQEMRRFILEQQAVIVFYQNIQAGTALDTTQPKK